MFGTEGGRGVKEVANFANDKTDRLRETANKGGEGVQNPENFANVINGCPLIANPAILSHLRTNIRRLAKQYRGGWLGGL